MKTLLVAGCTVVAVLLGRYLGESWIRPSIQEEKKRISFSVPLEYRRQDKVTEEWKPASVRSVFEHLSPQDGDTPPEAEVAALLYAELEHLPNDEFASAVIAIYSSEGYWSEEMAELLAGLWAERDLDAARTWVLSLKENQYSFARSIFSTWARTDLAGLCEWTERNAETLNSHELRYTAIEAIGKEIVKSSPEKGIQLMNALARIDGSFDQPWTLYNSWAQHAPEAAAERAAMETDESRRARCVAAVTQAWGMRDPAAACAWASNLPDPILSSSALASICRAYGFRNPPEAISLIMQMPRTKASQEAMKSTVTAWCERDFDAAFEWMLGLQDEQLATLAIKAISQERPEHIRTAIATLPEEQRQKVEQRMRGQGK